MKILALGISNFQKIWHFNFLSSEFLFKSKFKIFNHHQIWSIIWYMSKKTSTYYKPFYHPWMNFGGHLRFSSWTKEGQIKCSLHLTCHLNFKTSLCRLFFLNKKFIKFNFVFFKIFNTKFNPRTTYNIHQHLLKGYNLC